MARSSQLDPTRQYRKLYQRSGLESRPGRTYKLDEKGRQRFDGHTRIAGEVKLKLLCLRMLLNKRNLSDTLEALINAAYAANPECHKWYPEDHPLLAFKKAQKARQRVLANQHRVTNNHRDVTREWTPWEDLTAEQKQDACDRLGITLGDTVGER